MALVIAFSYKHGAERVKEKGIHLAIRKKSCHNQIPLSTGVKHNQFIVVLFFLVSFFSRF